MYNNFNQWKKAAIHGAAVYGVFVDADEHFFECPDCGEPLYECDWGFDTTNGWHHCPICEFDFGRDE